METLRGRMGLSEEVLDECLLSPYKHPGKTAIAKGQINICSSPDLMGERKRPLTAAHLENTRSVRIPMLPVYIKIKTNMGFENYLNKS